MTQIRSSSAVRPRRVVTTSSDLPGRLAAERVRGLVLALVLGQVTLVLLVCLPIGPVLWSGFTTAGWVLSLAGALIGVLGLVALGRDTRVSPIPAFGGRLHRNGIYAFVRHPMYLGLSLLAGGVTVLSGRLLAVVALMLLVALLVVKSRVEDLILQRKFGWEFAIYATRVPAIVPQPWRSHRR